MFVFKGPADKNVLKIIIVVGICMLPLAFRNGMSEGETKWQKLFDGKSLNGWHALPGGRWTVEDGVLIGRSDLKEDRHGILVSDREYTNFEIEVIFKSVKGNSGLYFRVDEIGGTYGVEGFQAEIHPEEFVGGLYETGGRQWVSQPKQEDVKKYNKPGKWNTMRVRAMDGEISVMVNGITAATLHNDTGRKKGHFGLQLHGGQEMLIKFKSIRIKEL